MMRKARIDVDAAHSLMPPFSYFGGKRAIAKQIWLRFGNPTCYIEPFFGGGSVLLARRSIGANETINDLDGYVANFWRSIARDPDAVAHHALYPIYEADLNARSSWLVEQLGHLRHLDDPDWYDARIAGWWCWVVCANLPRRLDDTKNPPSMRPVGLLSLFRRYGKQAAIDYIHRLSDRIARVVVMNGDWTRCVAPSRHAHAASVAVYLDPPYASSGRTYRCDSESVALDAYAWAVEHGSDARFRIAISGHKDDYDSFPAAWSMLRWTRPKGRTKINDGGMPSRHDEMVWFSPHCLRPIVQGDMFLVVE
jgi:hypothetical protein